MDLFRSPIWGLISTLVGLGIGAMGLVMARQRHPQFTYEVVDFQLAPTSHGSLPAPTRDSKVVVRIWNSGSANITPADYVHPVKLHFRYFGYAHIHSARIIESSPPDIRELESLTIATHHSTIDRQPTEPSASSFDVLTLPSMLLHPKDSLTIEAWITPPVAVTIFTFGLLGAQVKPTIGVMGRIVNITRFREHEKGDLLRKAWTTSAIGVTIALVVATTAQLTPHWIEVPAATAPILLACGIGLLALRWRLVRQLYGVGVIVGMSLLLLYSLAYSLRATHKKERSTPTPPQL